LGLSFRVPFFAIVHCEITVVSLPAKPDADLVSPNIDLLHQINLVVALVDIRLNDTDSVDLT
jgi:hypothetical protein